MQRSKWWIGSMTVVASVAMAAPMGGRGAAETSDNPWANDPTAPPELVGPVAVAPPTDPGSAYIVGGAPVTEGKFPDTVFITMRGALGSEGTCTGSIIHPNWILTAAHCVDDPNLRGVDVYVGESGSNFRGPFTASADPYVGRRELSPGQWEDFTFDHGWFVHPLWAGPRAEELQDYEADIALIYLKDAIDDVSPMAVNQDSLDGGAWDLVPELTFIGFGITADGGTGSGTKRSVVVSTGGSVLDPNGWLLNFPGNPSAPKSTCQGDSGGPGVYVGEDGRYIQYTITSHGVMCGEGSSGYVRTDAYFDWVQENLRDAEIVTRPTAPPRFACSNEVKPIEEAGSTTAPDPYAIGAAPLDLKCSVQYFDPDAITKVTWEWGDGETQEVTGTDVLIADHAYDTTDVYSIKMCAEFLSDSGQVSTGCHTKRDYVNVCEAPEVTFSYEATDLRTLQFINLTDVTARKCLSRVQWDIFEGDSATGEPVDSIAAWQPEYEFAEGGTYTVVLNVGGVGGTGAAKTVIDVAKATRSVSCGHVGPGVGAGAVALLGLALVRRRRS